MPRKITRSIVPDLVRRLKGPKLIQLVAGPRQVGKTTAVRMVESGWDGPTHYAAADVSPPPGPEWIETNWDIARRKATSSPGLLILDEVQKVRDWSEIVKANWDRDRSDDRNLRVVLVGSSSLLLTQGATDSLAGRFFLNRCPHWSYSECKEAFGWDLDRWLFFGGYPGAATLTDNEEDWRRYVLDSLIETAIYRDVLMTHRIAKPALLRNLFGLATRFPAQILSYNKMLGQLQEAGNTTTLAHYLHLLEAAFLASGLERYSEGYARSRGSSPKLVLWNNALVNANGLRTFDQTRSEPDWWGRVVENAVGGHLLNHLQSMPYEVSYWRHRGLEVDYVVRAGSEVWAVEVKSGRSGKANGLAEFRKQHPSARSMIIGTGGLLLEEFFSQDPRSVFGI